MNRFSLLSTAAAALMLCGPVAVLAQSPSQVQSATQPDGQSPMSPSVPAEIQAPPLRSGQSATMPSGTSVPMPSDVQTPAPGMSPPPLTPPAAAAPSAVQQPTPAPIVIHTKVDLRSSAPQSPESAADARKEAAAAVAEARSMCRHEGNSKECLKEVREDANALKSSAPRR